MPIPPLFSGRDNIHKYHIGSVVMSVPGGWLSVLLKSQPYVSAELLNRLQRSSQLRSWWERTFERGVSHAAEWDNSFPHARLLELPETRKAEAFDDHALEARAVRSGIGISFRMLYVNLQPANPIINTRFLQETRSMWSIYVAAYIKGAHEGGLPGPRPNTFPGHGDNRNRFSSRPSLSYRHLGASRWRRVAPLQACDRALVGFCNGRARNFPALGPSPIG